MKWKIILVVSLSIIISSLLFTGIAYTVTRGNLLGVDVPKTDVPYSNEGFVPENRTVLFTFPDNYSVAIDLQFDKKFVNAMILPDAKKETAEIYGFKVTDTVKCDYSFIMDFIDKIGGIDLNLNGKTLRYTGVQVCNLIASDLDDTVIRAKILESVFVKISKNGFSSEALSCIIEETDTSLSTPACYGWAEWIPKVCISFNIVNER